MPVVKTNYSCPTCDAQVVAENRKLVCSSNPLHTWNDIQTFMALGPKIKYEGTKPPVAPQPNHLKFEVSVPPRVKSGLDAKFGARSNETIAGVLEMLSEGEVLIIPASDLSRLKERLGKQPESSGELFGLVYNLGMELETEKLKAENAEKDLKAYEGRSLGCVVVDFGKNYQAAIEKARDRNLPLKLFAEECLRTGLENGWF